MPLQFDSILRTIELKQIEDGHKTKSRHKKKLDNLIAEAGKSPNKRSETNKFINLTNYQPTPLEAELLNQGPKFCPNLGLNFVNTVTEFENCLNKIPPSLQSSLRGFIIWKCIQIQRKEQINRHSLLQQKKIIKKLHNNNELRILMADKSSNFVFITNEDF